MPTITTNEDLASVADVIDLTHGFYLCHDLSSIDDDELKLFRRNLVTPTATVYDSDDEDIIPHKMLRRLSTFRSTKAHLQKRPVSRGESVMLFKKINNGDDEVSVDLVSSEMKDFIDSDFMMSEMYSRPASIMTIAPSKEQRYKEHRDPHTKKASHVTIDNRQKKSLLKRDDRFPPSNKIKTLETILENSKQITVKRPENNTMREKSKQSSLSRLSSTQAMQTANRPIKTTAQRTPLVVCEANVKKSSAKTGTTASTRAHLKRYEQPEVAHQKVTSSYTHLHNDLFGDRYSRTSSAIERQDASCRMRHLLPNNSAFTKKRSMLSHKYDTASSSSEEEDFSYYRRRPIPISRKYQEEDIFTYTRQKSGTCAIQPADFYQRSPVTNTRYEKEAYPKYKASNGLSHSIKRPPTMSEEGLYVANSARQVLASIQERRKMKEPKARLNSSFVHDFYSKLNVSDSQRMGAAANKSLYNTSRNKTLHEETKARLFTTRIPQRSAMFYH